jgi:hypothetical protein
VAQDIAERLARVEEQVRALRDTVRAEAESIREDYRAMHEQLHGPPWERSIRGRLHQLETNDAAAVAARAALEAATAVRGRTFGRREKIVGLALGVVGTGCAVGAFVLALLAATT